jgi:hypothetical protein
MAERDRVSQLRAYGRSMWPFIPPGSTLEVVPLGDRRPRVGEVVVGVRGGQVVAHRVVRVEGEGAEQLVVTRGDAHSTDDPPWRPEELLGVARRATVLGLSVALDDPAVQALGRLVATQPAAVSALRCILAPAARAGRVAAMAAAFTATKTGLLRLEVAPLTTLHERDLDRLLLLLGIDAAGPLGAQGSSLAQELVRGMSLGARLAGFLAAAIVPARLLGRRAEARPQLVVHPLARGSVEKPLVAAWAARGLEPPEPVRPVAPWQERLYRWVGVPLATR